MSDLVGIDVGGTFTDFVRYDPETQAIDVWKTLSTPEDPTDGIVDGLDRSGDVGAIGNIRFGTTIATNAILERKGATVAYVTTTGFRDVPFIQRGKRKSHYDITWVKSKPLVKRRHCYEVDERILARGEVYQALDTDRVRAIARAIKALRRVEAVAINFLFSFVTPDHERTARAIFAEECPDIPVSISYEVLPKWKEFERSSTTITDAYIKPVVGSHLGTMRARLDDKGITRQVAVIKSNGGEMTLEEASRHPIQMTLSGPTGGVVGAKQIARSVGVDHLVTLDMGGTSTDVSTVVGGSESFTTSFEIEFGLPIQIPMIDIRTMGAGGGSLAWIDKGGMLRMGPESAGANPGPACYGLGGTRATATDANLTLGRINPANFLGGAMALDAQAAAKAIAQVAGAIDKPVEETALAMVQIANNNMIGALRSVLTERGLDPRDFTLLAFGGAGPVHVADLMVHANIPSGIVPNHPGQFSAFGFLMTDAPCGPGADGADDLGGLRSGSCQPRALGPDARRRRFAGGAGLHQEHRDPPLAGDALPRAESRARRAHRLRPLRRDHDAGALAGLPSRPSRSLQFRHSGREDRDDLRQGHRGFGHRQAAACGDRQGRGRARAGGHAAGALRGGLGRDTGS